ncbi:MAG: putative dehydrogenase [Verrucomicrobiales bacterium]|jgi:predicted dehydrogenase
MNLSRRDFLRKSSTVAPLLAFPTIIPSHVLGGPKHVAPSDKVNVAIVGAGGKGKGNTRELLKLDDVQVTAIADPANYWNLADFYYRTEAGRGPVKKMVEEHFAAKTPGHSVAEYEDFRIMLEKESAIDAIVCSTPDHLHAYVTVSGLNAGKHVYCEKPLTHNIWEARKVQQLANASGLATQMGNSGHSTEGIRRTVEYLRAGAIGTCTEAHSWVPASRWNPQLQGHPTDKMALPDGLNWDLWSGPCKPRDFHSAYAPVSWRDFWEYGCGALGDFGCHDMDAAVWAYDLPAPESVEVIPAGYSDSVIAPHGEIGYYQFPARGDQPPFKMTWYSGGLRPDQHEALEGFRLPNRGVLFVGDKGVIQCSGAGGAPRLFPKARRAEFEKPEPTLTRSNGHYRDWIDAIKGGPASSANFDYSARLTEITLVGVLSLRLGGKRIEWDAANMKATGMPEADPLIREPARAGWEVG